MTKIKFPKIYDKKYLKSQINSGISVRDLARDIGCSYIYLYTTLIKDGILKTKKHKDYSNIELANWKTGEILKTRGASNLKDVLGWTKDDWIHIYPVIRGERYCMGNYCLAEHLKKEYLIVDPRGNQFKVKNWIKLAKKEGVHVNRFKELLDGELIYVSGFYLKENENIVPKKLKRLSTVEVFGKEFIFDNIIEFSREIGINQSALWNIINGKTRKTREGLILKAVQFVEK